MAGYARCVPMPLLHRGRPQCPNFREHLCLRGCLCGSVRGGGAGAREAKLVRPSTARRLWAASLAIAQAGPLARRGPLVRAGLWKGRVAHGVATASLRSVSRHAVEQRDELDEARRPFIRKASLSALRKLSRCYPCARDSLAER